MAGPSQPQVLDEVWDDDRIKSFLSLEALDAESTDFHVLLKAYRGMRVDDFAKFLKFFSDAERNIEALDDQGRTLWQIISEHRHGAEFLAAKQSLSV